MSDADFISKSRKKRDMLGLQAVGEQLIELGHDQLKRIELPETLRDAILDAKSIAEHPSKRGALKRQRQYVGRLMRDVEVAPIVEQLNALQGLSRKHTALLHLTEQWRERLITDEREAAAFLVDFPSAPLTKIRELVVAIHAERAQQKPPKHFRELYHIINALILEKVRQQP